MKKSIENANYGNTMWELRRNTCAIEKGWGRGLDK